MKNNHGSLVIEKPKDDETVLKITLPTVNESSFV